MKYLICSDSNGGTDNDSSYIYSIMYRVLALAKVSKYNHVSQFDQADLPRSKKVSLQLFLFVESHPTSPMGNKWSTG